MQVTALNRTELQINMLYIVCNQAKAPYPHTTYYNKAELESNTINHIPKSINFFHLKIP